MKADYILKSSAIFTGQGAEPVAGGVAVKGNKILKVLREEEVQQYEAEKVLDYGDRLIMAGFVDAHVHYFLGAIPRFHQRNLWMKHSRISRSI